jgi:2',3'-cyclic-nucleotide 2'-phosphodiesterase (5'-nucleotidase family)
MKKAVSLLTALMVLMLLALPALATQTDEPIQVTVFHTNDVHARVDTSAGMGYAMAAGYVNAERMAGKDVLLLDAGDTFHGMPFATISRGETIVDILNAMGYDAMAPGNHDYNYGMDRLFELKDMLSFPMLCANLVDQDSKPAMQAYTIKEFEDGIRIGIIGADNPEIAGALRPSTFEKYHLADGVEAVKAAVQELKDQTDAIIVLTHWGTSGVENPSDTLARIEGVDLVVDGHSHDAFETGYKVEGGATIVSTGEYLMNLGEVTLTIEDHKVTGVDAALIPAPTVYQDMGILDTIKLVQSEQDQTLSEVIGLTPVNLNGERADVRTKETNLSNILCDAMIAATGADASLTNGGGIRASIEAGDITKKDVVTVLPFGNLVVTKKVTGAQLKQAIEHGIRLYPDQNGGFPQVGGCAFTFDPAKEAGSRVVTLTVGEQPVDEAKEYVLATNDFMADGGDGYDMLAAGPILTYYGGLEEILITYIQSGVTLSAEADGRIQPTN